MKTSLLTISAFILGLNCFNSAFAAARLGICEVKSTENDQVIKEVKVDKFDEKEDETLPAKSTLIYEEGGSHYSLWQKRGSASVTLIRGTKLPDSSVRSENSAEGRLPLTMTDSQKRIVISCK